jgi:transporter family protein
MMSWILILLTVIFWGSAPILDKFGLKNATPFQGLILRTTAIMIVLSVSLLFSHKLRGAFNLDAKTMLFFAGSGLLAGLFGVLTYYMALKEGNASRIVPLASTYPMIAFVLSILILRENFTLIKLMGTLFVIVGVLLLK